MKPREEHRLIWKDSTSGRSLPLDQGLTIREQARKEAGDAGVEGRPSWKCIQGKSERVDDPGPSISTSTQPGSVLTPPYYTEIYTRPYGGLESRLCNACLSIIS